MIHTLTDVPIIDSAPASQAPPAPPGLVASYFIGPDGGQSNIAPVIRWMGYTYWVYGTRVNDWTLHLIAYDEAGTPVKRIDKGDPQRMTGARHLWRITVEPEPQTVTLHGQAWKTIVCTWDELAVPPPAR